MRGMATIIGCIAGFSLLLAVAGCGGQPTEVGTYDVTKDQARSMAKADWPIDFCEWLGWYGDGICDRWCPLPDPDCDSFPAQEGESCGADIGVVCDQGLYCAFGGNWCATPPVVGVCLKHGDCIATSDCLDDDNQWEPPSGMGISIECAMGECEWTMTPLPQPCLKNEQCPEGDYCTGNPDGQDEGVCLGHGECEALEDCFDPDNQWYHPMCVGYATCEESHCGWVCDDVPVVCESSDVCGEDEYCNFDGSLAGGCTSDEDCGPNGSCWDGMCVNFPGVCLANGACDKDVDCYHPDNEWVHPECWGHAECVEGLCEWFADPWPTLSCQDVGGVCVSTTEPPPPGTCAEHGLADGDGVCMGYDEVCCVMADCGGFWYNPCPGNSVCVDMPFDTCDPDNGGADCPGMCVDEVEYDTCGYGLGGCLEDQVCLDIPDGCDPQVMSDCPGACINPY